MSAPVLRSPGLLAALANMRNIAVLLHCLRGGLPGIALVGTQMLDDGSWATNHPSNQRRLKQLHIMPLGTAHDQ